MSGLMATYDPNWKDRLRVASVEFDKVVADPRAEARISAERHLAEMSRAYDSKYRTVVEYEASRHKEAEGAAELWSIELKWPEVGPDAGKEEVDATYAGFIQNLERLRRERE